MYNKVTSDKQSEIGKIYEIQKHSLWFLVNKIYISLKALLAREYYWKNSYQCHNILDRQISLRGGEFSFFTLFEKQT